MKLLQDYVLSRGAENFTTLVSVSLLLFIAGLAVALSVAGHNESERLRGNIEMTVVMTDSATDAQAAELASMLASKPYVAQAVAVGREQALRNWNEATGDDLETVYGVNPLSPEITVRLNSAYATPAQMQTLARGIESLPHVEGVALPQTRFVEGMNRTLNRIVWCLAIICLGLISITLVLINNMVHLGIYSRRFAIRTMQLVGATDAFVRRPFLLRHAGTGLLAGIIASALLVASIAAAGPLSGISLQTLLPWGTVALMVTGLIAAGILICLLAAWYATCRYLRSSTDNLFA